MPEPSSTEANEEKSNQTEQLGEIHVVRVEDE
jgi:hypothetical protein